MSLQQIINRCTAINIERKKVSAYSISRSGQVKTMSRVSQIPWVFTVTMHSGLKYTENRDLLEELDRLDRIFEEEINIGVSNPNISWITAYRGTCNTSALAYATVNTIGTTNVTVNVANVRTLGGAASTDYLVKKGDYISFGSDSTYRYPYTVLADTQVGSASTVVVPVNRPIITQSGYTIAGQAVKFGSAVSWRVKMIEQPSYTITPDRLIEFSSEFKLIEIIQD